jgi:prepilin-type N-terminal cleavage/methylation domain-containing protein
MTMQRHEGIMAVRQREIRRDWRRRSLASSHHRGFTLVELLIAVVVLLAVILALSRIFSTVSEVSGIGQASAAIMQEAAVIEKQLRRDIENLSTDGFFAIRQVAVRNDVHGENQLLDPTRPPQAVIRADQLVLFTDSVATFQIGRFNERANLWAQSNAARVYWGHAVQLPGGSPFEPDGPTDGGRGFAYDPGNTFAQHPLVPWRRGPQDMVRTLFDRATDAGPDAESIYNRGGGAAEVIDGTQPPPNRWLLARQAVLLADSTDPFNNPANNRKTRFGAEGGTGDAIGLALIVPTARAIFNDLAYGANVQHPRYGWSREIRNGRMDGAATTFSEIRRWLLTNPEDGNPANFLRPWSDDTYNGVGRDQWSVIAREVMHYPRGERRAPGMIRVDQALTNHIIGSAVSDFIVEWMYEDGVGDLHDSTGSRLRYNINTFDVVSERELRNSDDLRFWWPFGYYTNWYDPSSPLYGDQPARPWFGINRSSFCPDCPDRGVGFYSQQPYNQMANPLAYQVRANFKPADTIFPNLGTPDASMSNLERWFTASQFASQYGLTNWNQFENRVLIYEAFFGYNRTTPIAESASGSGQININRDLAYTPWPSAIRVSMRVHDPQGRIEGGRVVQFVIELPERVRRVR